MKKRFYVAFVLLVSMFIPSIVNAATVTNVTELQTALGGTGYASVNGNTVTLLQDVYLTESIELTSGEYVLNLENFNIQGYDNANSTYLIYLDGASLTINGNYALSGNDYNGVIYYDDSSHTNANAIVVDQDTSTNGSKLVINGAGVISEAYGIGINGSNVSLNNTTIISDATGVYSVEASNIVSTINMTNGSVTSDDVAISFNAGNVVINGTKISSTSLNAIAAIGLKAINLSIKNATVDGSSYFNGANVTIDNTTMILDDTSDRANFGTILVNNDNSLGETQKNTVVTINSGTFKYTGNNNEYAVLQNSTTSGEIIVNGGAFTGNASVIDNFVGKLTVTGGEFISSSSMYGALYIDEGEVLVTGGTFTGDEYAVELYNAKLTINNGKFTGKNNVGIYYADGDLLINGGEFIGYYAGLDVYKSDAKGILTGGTFIATATGNDFYGGISIEKNASEHVNQLLAEEYYYDGSETRDYGGYSNTVSPVVVKRKTYNINIPTSDNGTVTVSHNPAAKGDVVSFKVVPKEGYEVVSVTVMTKSGTKLDVELSSFLMPNEEVTISVEYKAIKDETPNTNMSITNPFLSISLISLISLIVISKKKINA